MEYASLAPVYDRLVHAGYEDIYRFYRSIWREFRSDPTIVLDLGCGTGSLIPLLEKDGRQVIGIDRSPEMLDLAREKAGPETLLLCQDMTELDLYGTVDAVICSLDCVNSLTEEEDVLETFRRVNLFLSARGLFVFDVNTPYKFDRVLDGQTFVYDEEDVFCVWENDYDREQQLCDFTLNLFFKEEDGSWRREQDFITERVYTRAKLEELIRESGLELVAVCGDLSLRPPWSEDERWYFVARKGKDAPNQER
ncbi:MAG: class I SAM-dependent methyltransferase [Clostridia bacterium]|nr:class I SAM-dependent methyltransferase [Clostridia bacterium]